MNTRLEQPMDVTERWIPNDKAELIAAIEREWRALHEVLARSDPAQAQRTDQSGWSPADHVAHLAEWINILMGFYMDLHRAHEVMGVAPEVTSAWDFEARNRHLFERNRGRSMEDVLAEITRLYGALMERLEGMRYEDLLQPQHPFDPARTPLLLYILRGTTEHFAEHRQAIEQNLSG